MWSPVDTEFFGPKTPVAIACVHDHENALVFRRLLEGLSAVTLFHNIGTPEDFLKVISQDETTPPYLVISGHGGDHGIEFGEYMEGIDVSMLVDGSLPAEAIADRVRLPGCVIVNITCDGGEDEMAKAFLSGGAAAYVGTDPNPNTTEHPIFLGHFFHSIIRRKQTSFEAWKKAAEYDKRSHCYHYFDNKGRHTINGELVGPV